MTDHEVPPPPSDKAEQVDWANVHIGPLTGTGKTGCESWYEVTVTACIDPKLVGCTFEFGI
jgi:hypothetical protein